MNIPRYVDSSDKAESFDVYATMFGGVPVAEINELDDYFSVFTGLKDELFIFDGSPYARAKVENIKEVVQNNKEVTSFKRRSAAAFDGFEDDLYERLVEEILTVQIASEENNISDDIFSRLNDIPLVDKYTAYQALDDNWKQISIDLEVIHSEGLSALTQVDPNMVIKKKDNKEVEVQDGWCGHILPFELVQKVHFSAELEKIAQAEQALSQTESGLEELIELIPDEDKGGFLNEDNTAFIPQEVANVVKPYKKSKTFPEQGSVDDIIYQASKLIEQGKNIKKVLKTLKAELHNNTKLYIESMSTEQAKSLLRLKWINPVIDDIARLPDSIVNELASRVIALIKKYSVTFLDVDTQIDETEKAFADMIDELEGGEFDMKGLKELQKLLRGE